MQLTGIERLNPSTYNPRTADPRRLDLIELSLRKLGFLLPIYATPDGEIISGHQRHHVARRMGVKHLPVEYTRAMDMEERKVLFYDLSAAKEEMEPSGPCAEIIPLGLTACLIVLSLPPPEESSAV